MLTLELSEAEVQEINYERYNYPCSIVQKRLHVLYVKSKGHSHQLIADIFNIHINTVTNYIKMYQSGGIEEIKQVNYGTNTSELSGVQSSIKEDFLQTPPLTVNEAIQRIEDLTGIRRSPNRVKAFMKSIGMKCRKIGHIPAKADPDKQRQWLDNTLEPHIDKAMQKKSHLFFMDAAHFVLRAFLCTLWSFFRIFIKSPSGRQRLNVLGAVNAVTKEVEFSTNTTYVDASVIADFLRQLANKYTDLPIVIVLDNARYQHCKLIKELATELGITLLFLPPYSPNLNIIERLWKFIKKKALYAKFYNTFELFKNKIIDTIHLVNHDYKNEINSLLTLRFQSFDNSQIYQV